MCLRCLVPLISCVSLDQSTIFVASSLIFVGWNSNLSLLNPPVHPASRCTSPSRCHYRWTSVDPSSELRRRGHGSPSISIRLFKEKALGERERDSISLDWFMIVNLPCCQPGLAGPRCGRATWSGFSHWIGEIWYRSRCYVRVLFKGFVWTKDKKQIKRPWKRNRKQSVITKSRLEVIKIERFEDTWGHSNLSWERKRGFSRFSLVRSSDSEFMFWFVITAG